MRLIFLPDSLQYHVLKTQMETYKKKVIKNFYWIVFYIYIYIFGSVVN